MSIWVFNSAAPSVSPQRLRASLWIWASLLGVSFVVVFGRLCEDVKAVGHFWRGLGEGQGWTIRLRLLIRVSGPGMLDVKTIIIILVHFDLHFQHIQALKHVQRLSPVCMCVLICPYFTSRLRSSAVHLSRFFLLSATKRFIMSICSSFRAFVWSPLSAPSLWWPHTVKSCMAISISTRINSFQSPRKTSAVWLERA